MSSKFTKILTYCILAVAIVVIAVCTAVCLSNAVGVAVSVDTKLISETAAKDNLVIKINGEETSKLNVKKGSEVTVTFDAVGYKFEGWYSVPVGEWSTATKKAETKDSYTFVADEDVNLTAAFNAIKYKINFVGLTGINTPQELTYGAELPSPADSKTFLGWQISSSEEVLTTVPAFEEREVTLSAKNFTVNSYSFNFVFTADSYSSAGNIVYKPSLAQVDMSNAPQREFYKITSIVLNGKTIAITNTNAINDELIEMGIVNAQNYKNETFEVNAKAVWTCEYTDIKVSLTNPFEEYNFLFDGFEEYPIEDTFVKDYITADVSGYKLESIWYNGNEYKVSGISDWNTLTVKEILSILKSNNVSTSEAIEISIDLRVPAN